MKERDPKAESITFGVELETAIPLTACVTVGGYHYGLPVRGGADATTRQGITAPDFNGAFWRAERDGSIRCESGYSPCEFVSPVLQGAAGVENLIQFVAFANAIGAKVNASCGCHITVGVASIIGTNDPQRMSEFARKLAHLAKWHAMSLYGQTGTGRHLNTYSQVLAEGVGELVAHMEKADGVFHKGDLAHRCGRGMVNFRKLFSHGVIEFRVFAGTLNRQKILHHLASVLGLCRRASQVECLGAFTKNKAQSKRTATAALALRYLWDTLGWTGSKRPETLGLFGPLHDEFKTYRRAAVLMCKRFDSRFPGANL